MKEKRMAYDAATRIAVITFPNGRELRLVDVEQEHADKFFALLADEVGRRDCVLHSVGGTLTREEGEANG
jgi:hypothetical protein